MSYDLADVLNAHSGRFVGDGVAATDLEMITRKIKSWSDWYSAWATLGDSYEDRARKALAGGAEITAGEFLWSASLSYQYAQFLWFHKPVEREKGQIRKQELYKQAARYLIPEADRFDLAYNGYTVPGYLRLPKNRGKGPFPCIILIGGLESTKEESYMFENICLRRGLSTCTFDGPGQGEMFFQTGITADFEKYCSCVIDFLKNQESIDQDRIAVLGRSLGGNLAVRCAAYDQRIKACVCWGALFDLSWWDRMPFLTREGFVYITKMSCQKQAVKYLKNIINLSGIAEKMDCPMYVLHGGKDTVIPGDQVEKLAQATAHIKDRTFYVEPEGNHCCHNYYPVVRPLMADWLALKMRVS